MSFNNIAFSANITKYRKRLHMTQRDLAAAINVTPQMISKYENALAVPDLSNLVLLAQTLQVTPNDLLDSCIDMQKQYYFIAVHGSPTETEFMLFDSDGTILHRLFLTNANPNDLGYNRSISVFREGIGSCIAVEPNIASVFIGNSGINTSSSISQRITNTLRKNYPGMVLHAASDIENIIRASGLKSGCAVIYENGSAISAFTAHSRHILGAYGHFFRSDGSRYDIGCEALKRMLISEEGLTDATALTAAVAEKLDKELKYYGADNSSLREKINFLYLKNTPFVAEFAEIVFSLYRLGDPEAAEILDQCFGELRSRIEYARREFHVGNAVAVFSDDSTKHDIISAFLEKDRASNVRFLSQPPIFGAALNAVDQFVRAFPEFSFDESAFSERLQKELSGQH